MTLLFDPVPHKYFIKEDPTLNLKSVSHLINLLKPKFDPDGSILKKYVAKGKSYILKDLATKWELTEQEARDKWGHLSFTEQEVAEIWKEKKDTSLVKGTKLHQIKEGLLLSKGGHPSLQDPETSYKQAYDLSNLLPGTYPELMLYYLPGLLTGTADIIKIDKDKTFTVEDYKGFALDTPIPTVDGWKLMQDIQVGDSIFDGNGKPTKVKHVSEIHHNPCFKIRFDTNNELKYLTTNYNLDTKGIFSIRGYANNIFISYYNAAYDDFYTETFQIDNNPTPNVTGSIVLG
ncbi:MAG: hypothetical protein EB127_27760, partial [Alphaproteobacteria bacterium]|nr:hypothetical protein [Alphaproteobacteria bacterium]